jgi:hypothetical protein
LTIIDLGVIIYLAFFGFADKKTGSLRSATSQARRTAKNMVFQGFVYGEELNIPWVKRKNMWMR